MTSRAVSHTSTEQNPWQKVVNFFNNHYVFSPGIIQKVTYDAICITYYLKCNVKNKKTIKD